MKIGLKCFSVSSISSGPGTSGRPLGVRPVRGACRRQRGGFIHHLQESLHFVMVHCQLCSRGRWGLDTSEINWGGVCLLDFLWLEDVLIRRLSTASHHDGFKAASA